MRAIGCTMPILETPRLILRHLTEADDAFILALLNDPGWLRNIGDRGVRSLEDARRYIRESPMAMYRRHGFGLYGVEAKGEGELLGICGLVRRDGLQDIDIGFAFLPSGRGKGYAFEAAEAVLAHGRDVVGLRRIVAIVSPGNESSIRLIGKLGLSFDRMARLTEGGEEIELHAVDF
jgi:RimJ/RimL family protein N-acetyltransferase